MLETIGNVHVMRWASGLAFFAPCTLFTLLQNFSGQSPSYLRIPAIGLKQWLSTFSYFVYFEGFLNRRCTPSSACIIKSDHRNFSKFPANVIYLQNYPYTSRIKWKSTLLTLNSVRDASFTVVLRWPTAGNAQDFEKYSVPPKCLMNTSWSTPSTG